MIRTLAMECPVEFGTLPDCPCPYEHWHVGSAGVCLDIHVEEEGYTHFFLDAVEWECETKLHGVTDLEVARPFAFAWAQEQLG